MELRKQGEVKHYDEKAEEWLKETSNEKWRGDFEGFDPLVLASYKFCYDWLKKYCQNKKILDYGCGNGIHTIFPAKMGAKMVIGIDLSEKSLEIARERARREGVEDKVNFLQMDCEKMEFLDNYFDIIFDGGTFSSLDLKTALPELARVLNPEGSLIGIETLGHNPFTNLKRKINKIMGKRTAWATGHIFQMADLEEVKKNFNQIETKFFHLTSWIAFPFLGLPGARFLLKIFETIDNILLKISFLKKYAFKIVFVFSKPKK